MLFRSRLDESKTVCVSGGLDAVGEGSGCFDGGELEAWRTSRVLFCGDTFVGWMMVVVGYRRVLYSMWK